MVAPRAHPAGRPGSLARDDGQGAGALSLRQLLDAVETLAQGKTLVQPAVTERLLHGLQRTTYPSLDAPDALTPRELEVVTRAVLRALELGYV